MSAVPLHVRQQAEQSKTFWTAGSISGWAAAVVGGLLAPPVGAAYGAVAVLCQALAFYNEQLASDPPDADYLSGPRLRLRPLDLRELERSDHLHGRLTEVIVALNDALVFLPAAITAYERAQGAVQAHNDPVTELRLTETRLYARSAGTLIRIAASEMEDLDDEQELPERPTTAGGAPAGPSDEVLLSMYRMGLPRREIELALAQWQGREWQEPLADLPHPAVDPRLTFVKIAEPLGDLGHALAGWYPRASDIQ